MSLLVFRRKAGFMKAQVVHIDAQEALQKKALDA